MDMAHFSSLDHCPLSALIVPDFQTQPMHAPFYNPERNAWQVFRYEEVKRVLSDYQVFSSQRDGLDPQQDKELVNGRRSESKNMISLDPPQHRVYRNFAASAFTPRRIEQLEPTIRDIALRLLDDVASRGEMDVVDDFARHIPSIVISKLLGVPETDRPQFQAWADAFFELITPAAAQAGKEINNYFRTLLVERRQDPQDDLISALLSTQVDGKTFSDEEINALCSLLILAGNDTTRHLISSALICFDMYPEMMEILRAQPELIAGALEEVLRCLPSTLSPARVCISDIVLGGETIKAGEWVLPMVASANRDEEQFPQAAFFDIRRSPNRHLSFGYGVHFCLGATLARLESRIALEVLLARFSVIKRVRDVPLEAIQSTQLYGVKHLPVTFTLA